MSLHTFTSRKSELKVPLTIRQGALMAIRGFPEEFRPFVKTIQAMIMGGCDSFFPYIKGRGEAVKIKEYIDAHFSSPMKVNEMAKKSWNLQRRLYS